MFYLDFVEDEAYLDGGDDKEGDIEKVDPSFTNEVLLLNMDYQNITCVFQDYIKDHDVSEPVEEENIEALHRKMVVMSGPLVNSLPCELIYALNMEINPTGIIPSSFD